MKGVKLPCHQHRLPMGSSQCLRLLTARCRLRRMCLRHLGAQARAARDRAKADKHALLVTLVKADARAPALNILQAQKILHLDICRRILSDLNDINQVHIWGFLNSCSKTADAEANILMTLRSIGIPKPLHIYKNQQIEQLEESLSGCSSLVVDLSESGSKGHTCPTVKSFLQTKPVEILRLSALLDTGASAEQAEGAAQFYRTFLSVVDDHIRNGATRHAKSEKADCNILQLMKKQETTYYQLLSGFETRLALDVLWEMMLLVKQRIESDVGGVVPPLVLMVARERLVSHLEKMGVSLHADEEGSEPATDGRLSMVIDAATAFRREVRSYALLDLGGRKELIAACDGVRDSLLRAGITIQDKKNQTSWLWAAAKK